MEIHCNFIYFFCILWEKHYAPVSQANWCNMTFTAGNLFTSHSCIDVTQVKPEPGFKPGPSMRGGQLTKRAIPAPIVNC